MHIVYLCDHTQHAATLAHWHYHEWHTLLPDWSEAEALDELQTHTQRRHLPTTLIALDGERLCGSVSLLITDHPQLTQYTPWLASLYVDASLRGRGIGTSLVRALMSEASALSLQHLYLYTTDGQRYYERLGWCTQFAAELDGHAVVVMRAAL